MKIGVISDTHDFFDRQVVKLFAGVDHILHAGDVGMPQILLELEHIAPVTAVLGNTDCGIDLKLTEVVTLGGRKFLVQHIVNPHAPDEKLRARLRRDRPDAVIFGHTHKPFNQALDTTLFFNPGYSGRPKFNTERSVALLHCAATEIRAEYLPL
ncbi:MAG TPA: metallophosphoesterase family protein [Dongiaceae bacterium]|jgi:putative phosphoesterase|nr:metallophosphoesterase family protein [Dongiaceae bacterium]